MLLTRTPCMSPSIVLYSWSSTSRPARRFTLNASKSEKELQRPICLTSLCTTYPLKHSIHPHPHPRRRLAAPNYAKTSTHPRLQHPHTTSTRLPPVCRSSSTRLTSESYLLISADTPRF